MIDWVDAELVKWGKYFGDNPNELGYPTSSVEARMKEGGFGNDNKGRRAPDPYVPENIALMETILRKLFKDCSEAEKVIKTAYMTGDSTREDQARWLTGKLKRNVSRTRLSEIINYLHHRIAGIYTGIELKIKNR